MSGLDPRAVLRGIRDRAPRDPQGYVLVTNKTGQVVFEERRSFVSPRQIAAGGANPPIFTATTPGIVPASGGGTANFLRADGTWDAPGGSGNICIDLYNPPLAASFTTFSGDGTSPTLADVTDLGLVLSAGPSTGGAVWRGAYEATPGATYTVIARLRASMTPFQYRGWALILSDGTKLLTFGFQNNVPLILFQAEFANFASSASGFPIAQQAQSFEYLRIKNDGTNRTYSVSADGLNWAYVYSEATGTFLTETKVGIAAFMQRNTGPATGTDSLFLTCPYWLATSP